MTDEGYSRVQFLGAAERLDSYDSPPLGEEWKMRGGKMLRGIE